MSNTFQIEGVAAEDAEIIQSNLDGVQESEKEATDQRVARMLEEERKAGRGVEEHEQDDEAEDEAQASDDDAAKDQQAKQAEQKESDSQRRRRLRREAATRTRTELAKANQRIGALQEKLKNVETKSPDPSRYTDDTYADYVGDRAGYAAQHVAAAERLAEAEAEAQAHQEALERETAQEMTDFFSEGSKRHPDFDKALRADGLAFSPAMVEALIEDGMHDLAYELAKQPHEVARIAALPSPILQVKEILKAQAALEAKAAESKTTKAPPPIKPIRAVGASPSKSPSEMTMAEYTEWRKKSMARA